MKHIQLYMLVTFVFCMQQISAGEQSQEAFETERQAIIDSNIIKYSYLSDAFNFLQSQNLVDKSFHDFLDNRLPHDKDEELEFGVVINQAEDILTANMRDVFIQTLDNAIKKVNKLNNPIVIYVTQHINDFMHGMVMLWLFEWSKAKDENGDTPLHRAIQYDTPKGALALITVGADVNALDSKGRTPLHMTAFYHRSKIAHILIDAGANPNITNNDGESPLIFAASNNSLEVARILINAGANINVQDSEGRTPLHIACIRSNKNFAHMFINSNANLHLKDNEGLTAEQRAKTFEMYTLFAQIHIHRQVSCNIS